MTSHTVPTPIVRMPAPPGPEPRRRVVLGGLLAAASLLALTGCTLTPEPSSSPSADSQPAAAAQPAASEAGAAASPVAAEAEAILAWQDRWYDNFCSTVVISMGDENCVRIAVEGIELIAASSDRVDAALPTDAVGDAVRSAADEAAVAADAFVAAACDTSPSDACIEPTDTFTDAVRAYADVLEEAVAAA